VKPIAKQSNKKAAFTIVELLTVMSIIIILIGLLVPAVQMANKYAKKVTQKHSFQSMGVGLELFSAEHDGYPDSGALDGGGQDYCGAMKLCEVMVGQDLKGFHPDSRFRNDGMNGGVNLYPPKDTPNPIVYTQNIKDRRMYLNLENVNAYKLGSLYTNGTGKLDGDKFVLCDVYNQVWNEEIGKWVGMPILYYKANTSHTTHDVRNPNNPENVYDYKDNAELVVLGKPTEGGVHRLYKDPVPDPLFGGQLPDWGRFYRVTLNDKIATLDRSYRADSFILISAGFDGEYGTRDDVFNFGR